MRELLNIIERALRPGRKTSEFALAAIALILVPVLDATVRAIVASIDTAQGVAVATSPLLSVGLAATSALIVAGYALGRSYLKAKTAEAAARALGDANLGRGTLTPVPATEDEATVTGRVFQ